jgi:hemolysin-activating ACP:hemolysin acyltransferase
LTVGDLIDLLSACDRRAPVRQAMNPFFPMAHRLAQVVQAVDETGRPVVYLAEARDEDTQFGHLPPEVAVELAWHSPVLAPPRRPRRSAGGKPNRT